MDKIIDLEKEYASLNVRLQLLESMMVNLMNTQTYMHQPTQSTIDTTVTHHSHSIQIQEPEPELLTNKSKKNCINMRQRKNTKNRYVY